MPSRSTLQHWQPLRVEEVACGCVCGLHGHCCAASCIESMGACEHAGAGDRLGLICEHTGEPLPAAMLPYAGRPIFERLLRDLEAREYLYFRIFGKQVTTPVAIMTSDAKGNHQRVCQMLEDRQYFGRPKDRFRLFNQPLVPVLEASTGRWVLPEALQPSMKPGGHGAIWKLMHDHGIFDWLADAGVHCSFATWYHCAPMLWWLSVALGCIP